MKFSDLQAIYRTTNPIELMEKLDVQFVDDVYRTNDGSEFTHFGDACVHAYELQHKKSKKADEPVEETIETASRHNDRLGEAHSIHPQIDEELIPVFAKTARVIGLVVSIVTIFLLNYIEIDYRDSTLDEIAGAFGFSRSKEEAIFSSALFTTGVFKLWGLLKKAMKAI
ncbi:hypothetical protein BOV90_10420 [Solemya velum gill symbiont]|uniref:hypothetical protein n=1 Tax=Solemya velum gill symbiont TaxID=2340 RepID=UPI000997398C|nr:hypothetical protein [Solemya velum gill symbiont]OOY39239.1 hypothetical protein BOV90_10420 [Solemya velum gill symbiont]